MSRRRTRGSRPCAPRPNGSGPRTPTCGPGGTHQARLERDIAWDVTQRRLADLDIGESPLVLRPPRPRARRPLVRRAPRGRGRGPHAARRRLAGAGRRALLPGDRGRADGASCAAATSSPARAARSSASTTRCSTSSRSRTRASGSRARARCSPRSSATAPAAWATSSPPSRPSRTRRSGPTSHGVLVVARRPGHRQDRGRAAPRRVPPLHAPAPAREPGRAARRAEPGVPPLHRARAPVARRAGRAALDDLAG